MNGCQVYYSLHRNALKQHRSKYTKNTNMESTYDVLAYDVLAYDMLAYDVLAPNVMSTILLT